jgi:hypothetical protein
MWGVAASVATATVVIACVAYVLFIQTSCGQTSKRSTPLKLSIGRNDVGLHFILVLVYDEPFLYAMLDYSSAQTYAMGATTATLA